MGYRRSAPSFSYFGIDQTQRTVDLAAENEERPAQIGGFGPRRPKCDGTLSIPLAAFVADWEAGRTELAVVG